MDGQGVGGHVYIARGDCKGIGGDFRRHCAQRPGKVPVALCAACKRLGRVDKIECPKGEIEHREVDNEMRPGAIAIAAQVLDA